MGPSGWRSLLAATMLVGTAGVALGHECVISSRSARATPAKISIQAAGAPALALLTLYGFVNQDVGGPAADPGQIAWAVGESIKQGLPANGWVIRG